MTKINNFKYDLAHAILRKLWFENYISEEEMRRIDERNKVSFGYTEPPKAESQGA